MEFVTTCLVAIVIAAAIIFIQKKMVKNEVTRQVDQVFGNILGNLRSAFMDLKKETRLADVEAVNQRISFLENLIERGNHQQRARIETIEESLKVVEGTLKGITQ